MECGHQAAFDKIFKMANTWRESSKMSITTVTFVGNFGVRQLCGTNLQSIDLMNVAPGSQGLASEVLDELSQILIPDDLAVETNQRLVAIETNKI
jgi:hypothetical protein